MTLKIKSLEKPKKYVTFNSNGVISRDMHKTLFNYVEISSKQANIVFEGGNVYYEQISENNEAYLISENEDYTSKRRCLVGKKMVLKDNDVLIIFEYKYLIKIK